MIITKQYELLPQKYKDIIVLYVVLADKYIKNLRCPFCGKTHEFFRFGRRTRHVVKAELAPGSDPDKISSFDKIRITYLIQRLKCKNCKLIHHVLPDTLVPYKRSCQFTVEYCIDSTKFKWDRFFVSLDTVHEYKEWFFNVKNQLINLYRSFFAEFNREVDPSNYPTIDKLREQKGWLAKLLFDTVNYKDALRQRPVDPERKNGIKK
jgi:hypothetical protein